MSLQRVVSSW